MAPFYKVLANTLITSVTNNFVWFALVFWAWVETNSVLATSLIGGTYLVFSSLCGFWFGSIVDHNKKKSVMQVATIITLVFFCLGLLFYSLAPDGAFKSVGNPQFWILVLLLIFGTVVGNIRNIIIPTLVSILVPKQKHDKANGLFGATNGAAFALTSVGSGLVLGFAGMVWVLIVAIVLTFVALLHLLFIDIPEKKIVHTAENPKAIDIKGTIKVISSIPGLFALIFFTTFNNLLGGVFMSLMDAYGLSLVSIPAWGLLLGILSTGFIAGGLLVAKIGLGKNPIKTLFYVNIIMWVSASLFTIQPWIILMAIGMYIWMAISPFVEATEQTIVQKVVPLERQGRVFGFAGSVEQAASPLTAFIIGPIAHFIFIPFMTTGMGAETIGSWYGTGTGRGIGLVFSVTGLIGLCMTLIVMRSNVYKLLAKRYQQA